MVTYLIRICSRNFELETNEVTSNDITVHTGDITQCVTYEIKCVGFRKDNVSGYCIIYRPKRVTIALHIKIAN